MTIGPLQLMLVKFADESRTRQVSEELKAVRKSGVIRMVDLLYIYKDPNGVVHEKQMSDLAETQKAEYGLVLRGLLGLRAAAKTDGDVDKITAAMSLTPGDFGMSGEQVQTIAAGLPNGGSAMLTLFEHVWAIKMKEALFNAGGELIAQGLLSPELMALGGLKLEEAVAAAQKIEADAEQAAAAQTAEAEQKLAQAQSEAETKLAEAQQKLAKAEAEAAARTEQARMVAAAAIAAGVLTASEEMKEAEARAAQSKQEAEAMLAQSKEEADALLEQSKQEAAAADALLEQSKRDAAAKIALGAKLAGGQVQAGQRIAEETILQGEQTAEEIKAAAATEALALLFQAHLIRQEATRQAVDMLVSASLIQQAAAEEAYARMLAAGQ